MRIQHRGTGQRSGKTGRKSTLSLRFGAAVLLFLVVLGVKNWLPQSEPAMSVLGKTLTADTDLSAVTRLVGQAAVGEAEWSAVLERLFRLEEEREIGPLPTAHRRDENRFLALCWTPEERAAHYLPQEMRTVGWLDESRGE